MELALIFSQSGRDYELLPVHTSSTFLGIYEQEL
jgi:hypothetical protein